jgi:hypothetical protein
MTIEKCVIGVKMKICPKCKEKTLFNMYGCGWDIDRLMCLSRDCDYEEELTTITYVNMNTGEIEAVYDVEEDI